MWPPLNASPTSSRLPILLRTPCLGSDASVSVRLTDGHGSQPSSLSPVPQSAPFFNDSRHRWISGAGVSARDGEVDGDWPWIAQCAGHVEFGRRGRLAGVSRAGRAG